MAANKENEHKLLKWNPRSSIEKFVTENIPSQVTDVNTYWMTVYNPLFHDSPPVVQDDYVRELWQNILTYKNKENISSKDVMDIARVTSYLSGKWVIKAKDVDQLWAKVAKATVKGELGTSAQVSSKAMSQVYSQHYFLIYVYTKNMLDQKDVMRVENLLRDMGAIGKLCYKPDIYPVLGLYRRNDYKISSDMYVTKCKEKKRNLEKTAEGVVSHVLKLAGAESAVSADSLNGYNI